MTAILTHGSCRPAPQRALERLASRLRPRSSWVPQRDATDCGAACLAMVTAFHGAPVGLARLRDLANVDADGATLWSLAQAAEALGFHARGLEVAAEALSELRLPAIVHWKGNHWVVLWEVTARGARISDPAVGPRRISRDELLASWTRRALELVPSGELVRAESRASPWRRFLPIGRPHWKMLIEVLLGSLLLSVLGLGAPFFTQTILDRVLVTGSTGLLDMLFAGMVLVTLLQAAVRGVRQLILVHVATRCDARLLGDFFRHVFRLPLGFFERHRVGDIVSRVGANEEIRQAMTSTLPAALLDAILATGYLAILLGYRVGMTGLVLALLPAFLILSRIFTPLLRRSEKEQFARHTEASTWVIEAVGGMATVKSMAAEQQARQRVESLFSEWLVAARRGAHLSAGYSTLASLVQAAGSTALLWYGAHEVISRLGMGYESEVGERGLSLSGGQRQRIALARALVRDPDFLFLDEATSALDSVSEEAIRESLRRITAGRTTIIIAHRLSTVRDADRILVLDEGRVVEDGRHDDLMRTGGLYAALAGAQLLE